MSRPKGSKNKHRFQAELLAADMGVDPLEFMLKMVMGDYEYFGFKEPNKISYTNAGIEFEEANLPLRDRVKCATEAAKYLYSAKQAIALSTGENGIRIVVEDYTKKAE